MLSDDEMAWLAGLSDAEACFSSRMRGGRSGALCLQYEVGLTREDVMREVRRMVQTIVGSLPELYLDPPSDKRRAFFRCRVVRTDQTEKIVTALIPWLCGKRLEAEIEADILHRAVEQPRYRASETDAALCAASQKLKRGAPGAVEEALRLLGPRASLIRAPGAAWLAGMFDGDGSVSIGSTHRDGKVYYQPFVSISSSDVVALEATKSLVETMGYGTSPVFTQKAKGRARPSNGFNLLAASMERFLRTLRPHLRVKGCEVDVLLSVYEGRRTRDQAFPILRALKHSEDPAALLARVEHGDPLPQMRERSGPPREYVRSTYTEMEQRGWWSSDEARKRLGGIGHALWVKLVEGLEPDGTIGNRKYYDPSRLSRELRGKLDAIVVRADARERLLASLTP